MVVGSSLLTVDMGLVAVVELLTESRCCSAATLLLL